MVQDELMNKSIAHLTEDGRAHGLRDHLQCVGAIARSFLTNVGLGDIAYQAGLWHDLGKYSAAFQNRIREANGFEAHIEGGNDANTKRDHTTAGAVLALRADPKKNEDEKVALIVAFAVAGHHTGIPDSTWLKERVKNGEERFNEALRQHPPEFLLARPSDVTLPEALSDADALPVLDLCVRVVYSALCDADFLDTEAFYNPNQSKARSASEQIDMSCLLQRLSDHIDALECSASKTAVNTARSSLRKEARAASHRPQGAFSLTIPTGGGKTLSGLEFALSHAAKHRLKRIIIAVPYTSIIEQNADVIARILGSEAVLEHHSALAANKSTYRNRLASENWDAPIIVTTTVQLFESLFSNRSSHCRKVHRLCESVVILDEAQALPTGLLDPILQMLGYLIDRFKMSVVLSTATLPALGERPKLLKGLKGVSEIVSDPVAAFEQLRRVQVQWPSSEAPTRYSELATQVAAVPSVLAIVHQRKDARLLVELLDEQLKNTKTIHLSASMCAKHRSEVLAQLSESLRKGEEIRVVSTQLIEAGVDIDFPVVFRAMAGLDSIAQAAGRCNREGRLQARGQLRIFNAETAPPPGILRTALGITQRMLRENPSLDPLAPTMFEAYFQSLLWTQDKDVHDICELQTKLQFKTIAQSFHMIEDGWSTSILVPWGPNCQHLIEELRENGPTRGLMRKLQRYHVSIPKRHLKELLQVGAAEELHETVPLLIDTDRYDRRFGLTLVLEPSEP